MGAIPRLEDCNPGIRPTAFCVLVAVAEQETKSGNLHLPQSFTDKQQIVEMRGRIVDVSPAAFNFTDWPANSQPVTGDAIIYGKLAGVQIDGDDGRKYRLLNDKDVLAIVEEK